MSNVTVPRGVRSVSHARDSMAAHISHATTKHFVITYSPRLGLAGPRAARHVAARCERDYAKLRKYFGGITPNDLPFLVRLTPGHTGASHKTCLATELRIGVRSAPRAGLDFVNSLLVMEEDEVFMAAFGHGWNCGKSNGEGLSRVLANQLYAGIEPQSFVTSSEWLDKGRPDFVNHTDPTDLHFVSIGCSVLFLNWLHSRLGHSWGDIIQAGGRTLARTYRNLGETGNAWKRFSDLMDQQYPPDRLSGLRTDNPFRRRVR